MNLLQIEDINNLNVHLAYINDIDNLLNTYKNGHN